MDSAPSPSVDTLRIQILDRRARLQAAASSSPADYLSSLIVEVDAALDRIEKGTYGLCETCHDPIEADRLQHDPLIRFCLDHLSGEQMKAHQQDLDLAVQIQSALLPPKDLATEGWDVHYRYQPVSAVGGDYCELMPLDGGKALFFAVGDVAGKGVAASLLMTHLSAIFRSLLSLNLPLAEVMSRANRLFCEGTSSAHYATLVCGRATSSGVELCDAGHCAPLLLRPRETLKLDSTGLPLGLFCAAQYEVRNLRMNEGDLLVLYSDGITEAQDAEGIDFGEERLLNSARSHSGQGAQAMAEGMLRDVADFRGAHPPSDDVTLLVLRRRRWQ
jgi:phosphoserine phosphatase RsbU/P